ncbi:MAG: hypothetical protein K2L11_09615, partial [Muribaculaceae bacterium]|nr:hypothetical protein [Muribaculaceae bacterium]
MRRSLIVAIVLGFGMLAPYATARTTYTLEELESMKKAGVLTGSERFVIIGSEGAASRSGGAKHTATLAPSSSSSWNERSDYDDLI